MKHNSRLSTLLWYLRVSIRPILRPIEFLGIFCLGLVLIFALAGIFGKVLMAFGWTGFFLLLSWGLIEAYKEFKRK